MADDAVTRLLVTGGAEFVRTLTTAADAQDALTKSIREASSTSTADLATPIAKFVTALSAASKESKTFKENLKEALGDEKLPQLVNSVTAAIKRQTEALQENEKVVAKQAERRLANAQEIPRGFQTGLVPSGPDSFTQVENVNFGRTRSTGPGRVSIEDNLERQRTIFLENEVKVREAVQERAALADKLREVNRVRAFVEANEQMIAREGQRAARIAQIRELEAAAEKREADKANTERFKAAEQTRRGNNAQSIFTSNNPQFNAATATTLKVTDIEGTTGALNRQNEAFKDTGNNSFTYLTRLSAIHAASFLLTGQTFSTFGSLVTLSGAFSAVAESGSKLQLVLGGAGLALGVAFSAFKFIGDSVGKVIQLVESAGETFLKFGSTVGLAIGAAVVASVKLASGVEDAFAGIAAFGEPTVKQFKDITDQVVDLSRKFGQSAATVGEGADLFIRAGGSIEAAIDGGTAAVTRLTIASRGELIPATAARSIVTVTNAFNEFKNNAAGAVDIIVGVAQKTALSFSEVTQALQQAGPTAAFLKIPLLDLATAIGVLANEGLRGQVAGTGLKQFLLDLLNPSKEAREKLQELNVSIRDQSNNIRPLEDIFANLKTALGGEAEAFEKTGDASRAQALAVIFGSRANLAAAIIARTGAEEFSKLKTAIGGVSASEVVNVLQSTTSAQAGILKTNIEALANAFGGPLNVAIGTALKSVNSFLQGIDVNAFKLAGQAVIAVFTGGGFGQIKEALDSIADDRVREFFTGLLNSALTVRNVIVDQLIPAFQQAGTNISTALGTVDISSKFKDITTAIVTVVVAGSNLVIFISELISDFITGNQRGQEIRDTLDKIATVVKGALTTAFFGVVVPIITGIAAIELFGGALQKLVGVAAGFERGIGQARVETFAAGAKLASDNLAGTSKQLSDVQAKIAALKREQETLVGPRIAPNNDSDIPAGLPTREQMERAFQIRDQIAELAKQEEPLILAQQRLKQEVTTANDALAKQATNVGPFQQLEQQVANIHFPNINQFLEGDVPSGLTALSDKLKAVQDSLAQQPERDVTTPNPLGDPSKADKVAREILDIRRRAEEEALTAIEDAGTREIELRRRVIDKLTDLSTKLNRDLENADKERDKKIAQGNREFTERRQDRDELQVIQRRFERESLLQDQMNAQRDQLVQQDDAREDRFNQRRIQDRDDALTRIENREQRSADIITQISDRNFQRLQQDAEKSFSRRQSLEEVQFSRQQQNAATERDNARRLLEAKTPEERTTLEKQIVQTRQDTTFSRGQEDQARAFRNKQEDAAIAFSRGQEETAFQRSITNEQRQFDFRVGLELKYHQIRRALEDDDTTDANALALKRLLRNQGVAISDTDFRLLQADRLQVEQDKFADRQHERENDRTREDTEIRKTELRQRTTEDTNALFDDVNRQRLTNQDNTLKTLQGINQRATRSLLELAEREPTAAGGAQQAILELQTNLVTADLLIRRNTLDAETLFETLRTGFLNGAGLPLESPRRSASFAIPEFPPDVNSRIAQAQSINLSGILAQILPPTVAAAVAASAQNQGSKSVTIDANKFNNDQILQLVQQLLFNSRP